MTPMTMGALDVAPADVCRILGAAKIVQVAAQTARGPHTTPQAYVWSGDSLWLVTARSSLKARVLRRRPDVGLMVRAGDESVVMSGTAQVLWPSDIGSAIRAGLTLPVMPIAGAAYAARNASLLAGYASDLLARGAPLPYDRIFIRVPISRAAVISSSSSSSSGGNGGSAAGVAVGALPDDLPDDVAGLLDRSGDAALTVATSGGPMPLPATWDAGTRMATIDGGALCLLDENLEGQACLTIDRSSGVRMSGFAGLMLRGHLTGAGAFEVDRVTWWHGFTTGTVAAARF